MRSPQLTWGWDVVKESPGGVCRQTSRPVLLFPVFPKMVASDLLFPKNLHLVIQNLSLGPFFL